jgi:hypothetical protein
MRMLVVTERLGVVGANIVKFGIGYGAVAAMILSYSVNKSILWMLIDGWFSWLYVIFFALFRG